MVTSFFAVEPDAAHPPRISATHLGELRRRASRNEQERLSLHHAYLSVAIDLAEYADEQQDDENQDDSTDADVHV